MTTPVRYYPTGPIKTGEGISSPDTHRIDKQSSSNIILAITVKSVVYVATKDNDRIVFQPLTNVTETSILTVNISGNVIMKIPDGNFLTISEENILSLSSSPINLKLKSKYSAPPKGYIAFSGVDYEFINPLVNNSLQLVYYKPNDKIQTIRSRIFIIASAYFSHTTGNVSTTVCMSIMEDPLGAAKIFSDSFNRIKRPRTWTRVRDCTRSVDYDYCLEEETCGKCLGPCPDSQCIYGKETTFVCSDKGISLDTVPDQPFHLSTIVTAIIIILVMIAVIILIYTMSKRSFGEHKEKIKSVNHDFPAIKNGATRHN